MLVQIQNQELKIIISLYNPNDVNQKFVDKSIQINKRDEVTFFIVISKDNISTCYLDKMKILFITILRDKKICIKREFNVHFNYKKSFFDFVIACSKKHQG